MRNCALNIDGQSNEASPLTNLLSNSKCVLDKVTIVIKPGAENRKLLTFLAQYGGRTPGAC